MDYEMCKEKKNYEIVSSFGPTVDPSDWLNINAVIIKLSCYNQPLPENFKFMTMSFAQSNEILDTNLESMATFLQSKLDVGYFADLDNSSRLENFYIGRVRSESYSGKNDSKSLLFECTRFTKARPRLDLSELSDYYLFPGQILALKGVSQSNDLLTVKEIVDPNLFILPFSKTSITLDSPINIVIASGPFCLFNSSSLNHLDSILSYVHQTQPHLLIIYGPFSEPSKVIENVNPENVFIQAMDKIESTLSDIVTNAVVIPSPYDLNHLAVFPTPPYQGSWSKISFFANPCLINASGLVIGCCSADILLHLTKQLVERLAFTWFLTLLVFNHYCKLQYLKGSRIRSENQASLSAYSISAQLLSTLSG